jgi:Animal haem peroxidase
MKDFGHGAVGMREQAFTTLLPLRAAGYPPHLLAELAKSIAALVDEVKDGADSEENLWLPAGYTYFGQFIDHDLTFDNTSSLNPADAGGVNRAPTNLRTPRFDLDSLYGDGPDAQPYLYDQDDGASLLLSDYDLLRSPNGRAMIGDKRNDENSLINQIHSSFIKFHNAVVKKIAATKCLTNTALFEAARQEVRWSYQKLVIEDFLPRIVKDEVLADLHKAKTPQERQGLYALYTEDKRMNLPREFVVAAYRFGHSGVRFGYRLNTKKSLSIFAPSDDPTQDSLLGFDPLEESHVIDDWGRFFPCTLPTDLPKSLGNPPAKDVKGDAIENTDVRLQFAYKIDPTLVDPLTVLPSSVLPTSPNPGGAIQEVKDAISPDCIPDPLGLDRPSLALLNLLRANTYKIQSGQAIAKVLKEKGFTQKTDQGFVPVKPLDVKYLVTRQAIIGDDGKPTGMSEFAPLKAELKLLKTDTPLWFYILAEAQQSVIDELEKLKVIAENGQFPDDKLLCPTVAKTQLGWVGGRIVAEVFYGLMDSDTDSYFHAPPAWKPIWASDSDVNDSKIIFANMLKFAGQCISHPQVPSVPGC